jgi:hypothetical protein
MDSSENKLNRRRFLQKSALLAAGNAALNSTGLSYSRTHSERRVCGVVLRLTTGRYGRRGGIDQAEIEEWIVAIRADILSRLLQNRADLRGREAKVGRFHQRRYSGGDGCGRAGTCGLHIPDMVHQLSVDVRGQGETAPARARRRRTGSRVTGRRRRMRAGNTRATGTTHESRGIAGRAAERATP